MKVIGLSRRLTPLERIKHKNGLAVRMCGPKKLPTDSFLFQDMAGHRNPPPILLDSPPLLKCPQAACLSPLQPKTANCTEDQWEHLPQTPNLIENVSIRDCLSVSYSGKLTLLSTSLKQKHSGGVPSAALWIKACVGFVWLSFPFDIRDATE